MIDHMTFGTADFVRSTNFYNRAFAPLGIRRLVDIPAAPDGVREAGYGDSRPWFWLAEERAARGLMHMALRAESRTQVDAFHAAALRAGGTDNGAPGLRPHYHRDYYAAFVLDPEGHNIEAVCHVSDPQGQRPPLPAHAGGSTDHASAGGTAR
ncbi:MAG: VOC family protein [Marinibacterium sp.]